VRILVFSTPRLAARALAGEVARAVSANPRLVLGLPAGRTPIECYRELAARCRARRLDLSRVTAFSLDEFVGIAPADPRSYRAFMRRHLFDRLARPPRRVYFLNGTAADIGAECARYDRAIRRAGGLDLLLLGLGANGHIGFNEPAAALVAPTHRARLAPATRRANRSLFGKASAVPPEGLSMGMATILHAKRIVLIATGPGKASAAARMVNGPLTPRAPASFLQLHRDVEVWLDRAAASGLRAGAASHPGRRGRARGPIIRPRAAV